MKKIINYSLIYFAVLTFIFYGGFKTGIRLRSYYDQKLIPNFTTYYTKFKERDRARIYLESFLRYMSVTKAEYRDILMELYYHFETKPLLTWFARDYLKKDSVVIDLGGATGLHWKDLHQYIDTSNSSIYVIDIDEHAINWGKKYNSSDRVEFVHLNMDRATKPLDIQEELKKTEEKSKLPLFKNLSYGSKHYNNYNDSVTTILLCQVYMQIPNANQLLKSYADKYPNAEIVVIHSAFPESFLTKIISFFKKYVLRYTYLEVIQGRAMTDKILYKELDDVGLKVVSEYDLDSQSMSVRAKNKLKAYVIRPIK